MSTHQQPAHRGLQTHAQHAFFILWAWQRVNLPRCRVLLQFKGLSGGLPQWRAAYDEAANWELSQSETHNIHSIYWQYHVQNQVLHLKEVVFLKSISSADLETLLKMHLLWSWALTVFQYPGESVHQRRTMAPLCRELVQSACISAANVLVRCVC